MGSGGHGVPPLKGPDGKTFVSRCLNLICSTFWEYPNSVKTENYIDSKN